MNWKNMLKKLAGLGTAVTKEQKDRDHYKGLADSPKRTVESPQRSEFTGDKYPSGGKSVAKELAADKERQTTYKKLRDKGEVPVKVNNQKDFGSQIMTDKNSVENVADHEEIGKGAEPKYVVDKDLLTKKIGWRKLQSFKKTSNVYLRCPSCGYEEDETQFNDSDHPGFSNYFGYECPRCNHLFSKADGDPVHTSHPFNTKYKDALELEKLNEKSTHFPSDVVPDMRTNLSKVNPRIQDQFMGHSSKKAPSFYVGAKFASVRTKNKVTLETVAAYSSIKEKVASGEYKYVDPTNVASTSPSDENSVVVAYSRENDNQKYACLIGNFTQSFRHVAHEQIGKEEIASAHESTIDKHNQRTEGFYCDVYRDLATDIYLVEIGNDRGFIKDKKFDDLSSAMSDFNDIIEHYSLNIEFDNSAEFLEQEHYDYTNAENEDRMRDEYDFSKGERGKYVNDSSRFPLSEPEHFASKKLAVSPPHSEYTVHELKKHPGKVKNPFGLAWWMKNKGYHLHDTKPKESSLSGWRTLANVDFSKKPDGTINISVEEPLSSGMTEEPTPQQQGQAPAPAQTNAQPEPTPVQAPAKK